MFRLGAWMDYDQYEAFKVTAAKGHLKEF